MNPWNHLLESLHSAALEEITLRHPDPKPVLGMPIKSQAPHPPDPIPGSIWIAVDLNGAHGFVKIGLDADASRKLGQSSEGFWKAVCDRAQKNEFARRKITPQFGPAELGSSAPALLIWIPFDLRPGQCGIGVGK